MAANESVDAKLASDREAAMAKVLEHFRRLGTTAWPPVGFAYAVEGQPMTVRAFAHRRLLESQLEGFAQAMCLEAELAARTRGAEAKAPASVTAADVIALVRSINEAEEKLQRTNAANFNRYRVADAGFNGACILTDGEYGVGPDTVITVDWTAR